MDNTNQLWGHGENITASQRRRKATKNSPGSIAPESMNKNGDYSEDENLFDIIERELDEREEEARREQQQHQQRCFQEQNDGKDNKNNFNSQANAAAWSQSGHDDDEVDFLPMRDDWTTKDGSGIGMIYSPAESKRKDEASNNDISRNQFEATDGNAAMIPRTISKRRREYSVIKSTTPRFSFQTSGKSTSTTIRKSPMERHSISSPLLSRKSDKQLPKKSVKRKHRHSFRQFIDHNASLSSTAAVTEVNNNMRELGFAPKFLANTRAAGVVHDDAIGDCDDNDARTKRKWNRLTFSQAAATSPYKQSTNSRRNKAGGYLIQNLRSLRNNDQRMAMRLRASTGGYCSAPMSSKRRRNSSGGGSGIHLLGPKQGAASELDVTVMDAAALYQNVNESSFGAGKIRLAYIHRYTGTMNYILPCYSWIVLPQNVINEQSIGEGGGGGSTQLRCYDAIIIPSSVASISAWGKPFPLTGLQEHELPLPTIICANDSWKR